MEAPSGFMFRGTYNCIMQFVDGDGKKYLQFFTRFTPRQLLLCVFSFSIQMFNSKNKNTFLIHIFLLPFLCGVRLEMPPLTPNSISPTTPFHI